MKKNSRWKPCSTCFATRSDARMCFVLLEVTPVDCRLAKKHAVKAELTVL